MARRLRWYRRGRREGSIIAPTGPTRNPLDTVKAAKVAPKKWPELSQKQVVLHGLRIGVVVNSGGEVCGGQLCGGQL